LITATVLVGKSSRQCAAFLKREDARNRGLVDAALAKNRTGEFWAGRALEFPSFDQILEITSGVGF
jgi:hypothetical protein